MSTDSDVLGQILVQTFAKHGYQAALPDPSTISISFGGKTFTTDISALREYTIGKPETELSKICAEYVTNSIGALSRAESQLDNSFSSDNLRLRIYSEQELGEHKDQFLTRELAPGLCETVVIDYPDSLIPLSRQDVEAAAVAEIFDTALKNSLKEEHYRESADIEGVSLTYIGGEQRYVGSHVHILQQHIAPLSAPHGALIAFPLPEYLLIHVINDTHIVGALETLQNTAQNLFAGGEKPISKEIFWWHPSNNTQHAEQGFSGNHQPKLYPVGIELGQDGETITVAVANSATKDLIDLWMTEHAQP